MFQPTHRVLIKATDTDHTYEVIDINTCTGLFKKSKIKQELTTIRVREYFFAEEFKSKGLSPLTLKEAILVTNEFNDIRKKNGYQVISFSRLEEELKKSNTK